MAVHSLAYHVDLCAGSGMLGLAVKLALAGRVRTVAYVEREAYAAATLVARMADASLDSAPVWDDVTSLTDPDFLELVQEFRPLIVTAGYPCQPFSVAGKRLGVNDERHLWPHIDAFIGAAKPECVFLENVPGHLRMGFGQVRRDLENRGYRVAAGLFSAAEVGASHRRERLFILALEHTGRDGRPEFGLQPEGQAGEPARSGAVMAEPADGGCGVLRQSSECRGQSDGGDCPLADAVREGRTARPQIGRGAPAAQTKAQRQFQSCDGGEALGDAAGGEGDGGERGAVEQAAGRGRCLNAAAGNAGADGHIRRIVADADGRDGNPGRAGRHSVAPVCGAVADSGVEGLARAERRCPFGQWLGPETSRSTAELHLLLFAPGPGEFDPWREALAIDPTLEPAIHRMADGLATGMVADRLRLTGNGVVPLAATYAFVSLFAALCEL